MARDSAEREDLMAEAIALSPRVEFVIRGSSAQSDRAVEIVAGRRSDGRWSVFFDGDPVYHFDSEHRLRRAFVDGVLYRSQGTTLARLTRQETQRETVLLRHDLTAEELVQFFQRMRQNLQSIVDSLSQEQVQPRRCVPEDANCLPDLAVVIAQILKSSDSLSPAISRR